MYLLKYVLCTYYMHSQILSLDITYLVYERLPKILEESTRVNILCICNCNNF